MGSDSCYLRAWEEGLAALQYMSPSIDFKLDRDNKMGEIK